MTEEELERGWLAHARELQAVADAIVDAVAAQSVRRDFNVDRLIGEAPPLRPFRIMLDRPTPPPRPRRPADARARRRAARRARRLNR
jgi:hypothetical protein